jgi:hypothetical protein
MLEWRRRAQLQRERETFIKFSRKYVGELFFSLMKNNISSKGGPRASAAEAAAMADVLELTTEGGIIS